MQQDNNSDFPDVELLTHLAPAQESEQHAMETGAGSTASVEASNGHIPSDVHLTEEHQDPPNCKLSTMPWDFLCRLSTKNHRQI
jgi:hypothetical protein